jgi:N-acetylglucosaminyldiphosphoundecaprenol N-acetyl-beta-D-mannosaminyltransferase
MSKTDQVGLAKPWKLHIASLDVTVTPSTAGETVNAVATAVENTNSTLVGAHNLHSVYLLHTNERFRRFYDVADLVLIDGWPILAAINRERSRGRLPEFRPDYRIGSTDWIPKAIQSPQVSRVCVIGASRTSNMRFVERQHEKNESVEFLGYPGVPWSPARLEDLIDSVRTFRPQLTLVGMGMPLQEEIALALRAAAIPGVIATVGGAIDQLSGKQAHAPRWTGQLKVEWLWRLASDPRRLAHRYLVEPIKLLRVLRRAKRSSR